MRSIINRYVCQLKGIGKQFYFKIPMVTDARTLSEPDLTCPNKQSVVHTIKLVAGMFTIIVLGSMKCLESFYHRFGLKKMCNGGGGGWCLYVGVVHSYCCKASSSRFHRGADTKLKLCVRFEIPLFSILDFGFQAKIPDSKPSFQCKIY